MTKIDTTNPLQWRDNVRKLKKTSAVQLARGLVRVGKIDIPQAMKGLRMVFKEIDKSTFK